VSSTDSPSYALTGFLKKILNPVARILESFIKNSGHFVRLIKYVNLQSPDSLIRFDNVSLFTNVPVDEALQVISQYRRHTEE
jgi:hypothetical protein